jgi:integrase
MPKLIPPLTDTKCRQAKPAATGATRLFDGGGLFLDVLPSGSKRWRMKYRRPDGKENLLTFGEYPAVTLTQARAHRADAKALLAAGTDPALKRDIDRVSAAAAAGDTFRVIAEEYLASRADSWSANYLLKNRQLLARDLYPDLGAHPIASITPVYLLAVVRKIEARGAYEMPRRALVLAGQIFQYAIGIGKATTDPSAGMSEQLKDRPPVVHYPHVGEEKIPSLLAGIDSYVGRPETIAAVKLAVLTFIRGGELRYAEWSEFDMDAGMWTVPTGRMKGRIWHKAHGDDHLVPLSRQAIALLEELRPVTGQFKLVFPGAVSRTQPVTGEAMNKVFHSLGFKGQQTVHGLRGLASTYLNESHEFDERVIEAQLSHKEKNKVKAAYNHAKYMGERRRIMQWWADYIDHKAGKTGAALAREA